MLVCIFFINFSSFKSDTENNANFEAIYSKCTTLTPLSKQECLTEYNSFWTKTGRRTASIGCWWSSEQLTGVRALSDAVHVLIKTSTQLSRCCWVRKTSLRATGQSEKFHVRRGIQWSSVSRIIHKYLHLKCCKKRCTQQLTGAHKMHALLSICSFRDDNTITSKPTLWVKNPLPQRGRGFLTFYSFFHKQLRILNQFYIPIIRSYLPYYKFLFNYLQLWWSYAILSATI